MKGLGIIFALAAIETATAQSIMAVKVKPRVGEAAVWILKGGRATVIPDSATFSPLSWSSDARWIVFGSPAKAGLWRLALVDTTSAALSKYDLDGECSDPSWSPDGKAFVTSVSGSGIRLCKLAGSDPLWSPLLPSGTNPAWSPTGGKIAFIGSKGGPSGWISTDDGESARAFFKQSGADSLSWSPDGRTIALDVASKSGGEIFLVPPSGANPRNLAQIDNAPISWSPDAKSILAKQKGKWVVVSTTTGRATATALIGAMPQWSDSKTLAAIKDGALVFYQTEAQTTTPFIDTSLPEGQVEAFAAFRGLVLDGTFDNPWKKAPAPKSGQIRLIGTVQGVELEDDTAKINVWSVMTPDGMELHLANPLTQGIQVTSLSTRVGSNGNVRLEATDLSVDSEVMMVVEGTKAGVGGNLVVDHALLPDLVDDAAPGSDAFARPARILEHDGVCMDHVLVEMVFPVLGNVDWSDTFLASRGGGSRRHHGQDLIAPKMRQLVATFDGFVRFNRSSAGHYTITLKGDQGWTAVYMHVNNDSPGTDDGQGGERNAFAPGLRSGDRVAQGQLLGYCGDSGNAESTGPHCHFELRDDIGGGVFNATPSLERAKVITEPVCPAPVLDFSIKESELRWDAIVTKVDTIRKVIVAELIGERQPGGTAQAVAKPRVVYIKVGQDTTISVRSDSNDARKFEDLKAGQYLTAVGSLASTGNSLESRHIGVGLGLGQ